jgi:predicted MFS family arabinose efflux permease
MSSQSIVVPAAEARNEGKRWLALALVVAAQFMVVLDVAIVNVALPSIKTDLNFTQESLQWVVTAYAILFGGALLLGGRMADLLGRRRLFMAGLVLFTVSSLLDGLAWSEGSLITFRALQGLGAALLSPAALSILTTTFKEGRERNAISEPSDHARPSSSELTVKRTRPAMKRRRRPSRSAMRPPRRRAPPNRIA